MEETQYYLEMNYLFAFDFLGVKHIESLTSGKEHYRIYVIISITGDGY